jgi:hypothetical protein
MRETVSSILKGLPIYRAEVFGQEELLEKSPGL